MPKGYIYILECSDGSYYTGSTIDIEKRIQEHNDGKGANHTKKRLPVKLVFFEEFQRIDDAFYREKQIQGWSRKKKEALIEHHFDNLPKLSECMNDSHYKLWLRLRSATENRLRSATENRLRSATEKNNLETEPSRSFLNKNSSEPEALEGTKNLNFKSNGKLLLTAEYVVLDGAKALALPTKYGQSLTVETNASNSLTWKSYDEFGIIWFEGSFKIKNSKVLNHTSTHFDYAQRPTLSGTAQDDNVIVSKRLIDILNTAKRLNPDFLNSNQGYTITTQQDFNRHWGLGTSSTLINNIANWANVDAYLLLKNTFGGSGYDIACAQYNTPITFQLNTDKLPNVEVVDFNPLFKNHLYFVYLNQKQNSRSGIANYRKNGIVNASVINAIDSITDCIITSKTLSGFNTLLLEHERIISKLIKLDTIQSQRFNDFNGVIKSLGAWGGDFVLVTSEINPKTYFNSKGFDIVIPYRDMVFKNIAKVS